MIFNKEKETDSVIIFLHIPKTGGTTLNSVIDNQYRVNYNIYHDSRGVYNYLWPTSLYEYIDKIGDINKLHVLRGHFIFGVHRHLLQNQYSYITLLRNPIDRVVSEYYFAKNSDVDHPFIKKIKEMTLYEFVNDQICDVLTLNRQTYMLSGKDDVEIAKNNLKKYFSVVGITERFDETLYALKMKFNWRIDGYRKKNITKNRLLVKEISNDILEIIKRKNQKDIELYRFANKLLDKQVHESKERKFIAEVIL